MPQWRNSGCACPMCGGGSGGSSGSGPLVVPCECAGDFAGLCATVVMTHSSGDPALNGTFEIPLDDFVSLTIANGTDDINGVIYAEIACVDLDDGFGFRLRLQVSESISACSIRLFPNAYSCDPFYVAGSYSGTNDCDPSVTSWTVDIVITECPP